MVWKHPLNAPLLGDSGIKLPQKRDTELFRVFALKLLELATVFRLVHCAGWLYAICLVHD
jgi:hypothetical protein